jgi:hypothetical protein
MTVVERNTHVLGGLFTLPQNIPRIAAQETCANTDFMSIAYSQIGEPLNLHADGQKWFRSVYNSQQGESDSASLLLGATPWLTGLLAQRKRRVFVVDHSPRMLTMLRQSVSESKRPTQVELHEANWLDLPTFSERVSVVLGDNSFSFIKFPGEWIDLCRALTCRMQPGGLLMLRLFSVPPSHVPYNVENIVRQHLCQETINYTEVRAKLLFSHWDRNTASIDTESVCRTFEANRSLFDNLFRRFPVPDNDLATVVKYKDTGHVFYAPQLEEILGVLGTYFQVSQIHFGPYTLSYYFPLIVARLR